MDSPTPQPDPVRIPTQLVESSLFTAVGYDAHRHILAVEFKSTGSVFHYAGISEETYEAMLEFPSLGSYFNRYVKGKFEGEKMTGPCLDCGHTGWVGDRCESCSVGVYTREPRKEKP